MLTASELQASEPGRHRPQVNGRICGRICGAVAGLLLGCLPVHAEAFDGLQTTIAATQRPAMADEQPGNVRGNVRDDAPGDGRTADITGLILPLLGALCLVARRRYSDRSG